MEQSRIVSFTQIYVIVLFINWKFENLRNIMIFETIVRELESLESQNAVLSFVHPSIYLKYLARDLTI